MTYEDESVEVVTADKPVEGDDEDVEAEDGMGAKGHEEGLLVNFLVLKGVTI